MIVEMMRVHEDDYAGDDDGGDEGGDGDDDDENCVDDENGPRHAAASMDASLPSCHFTSIVSSLLLCTVWKEYEANLFADLSSQYLFLRIIWINGIQWLDMAFL